MENDLKSLTVLIPAYKPGESLVTLVKELIPTFGQVLVVDDGCGESFRGIFESVESAGCRVVRHAVNMGKGRALKTGINDILVNNPDTKGVITADADGQHLVKDIINVGRALLETEKTMIIGARKFKGVVPLKSRFGNTITRHVFNFVSGLKITDTQTGLRGIPASSLPDMMKLKGERYEYEMDMLLEASRYGLRVKEIEIDTVYIDEKNSTSHFNPLKDSFRIYKLIVLFAGSSLFAFIIDWTLFTVLMFAFPALNMQWLVTAGSRIPSATINFFVNRNIVFSKGKGGDLKRHAINYFWLAAVIMLANYIIIYLLRTIGLNEYVAKLIAEVLLFFVSYTVQKRVVFK